MTTAPVSARGILRAVPFPNTTPARGTRGPRYSASGSLPGVEHQRVTMPPCRCPLFTAGSVSLDFPRYTAGSFSAVLHWVFVAVTTTPASARGILRAVPFPNTTPARGTRGPHYSASGSLPGLRLYLKFNPGLCGLNFKCLPREISHNLFQLMFDI